MSGAIRVAAQAKINLRLKVLDRLESGYHAIETVFARLELADRVSVTVTDRGGFDLRVTGEPSLVMASGPAEQNLALIAARAFTRRAGWHPRVEITVEKRIPVGAGLGGGSADAAAVLRALNALAPVPLPLSELKLLAAEIGSDVPFLVTGDAMSLGWGRGERLRALPPLPSRPVILGIPAVHVSTGAAYGWLGRKPGGAPVGATLAGNAFESWEGVAGQAENDFAEVVAARHPVIRRIRDSLLERGARIAMLTGSGSAVFGIFESEPPAGAGPLAGEWEEVRTATAAHVVPLQRMD